MRAESTHRIHERGFGLIELMVSLAVIALLMLAMFAAFFHSSDEQDRMSRLVEFRQSARASVQLFERDLRMAGSGWGRSQVRVWNGADQIWYAMDPGPGAGPNDSISIFGAWAAQTFDTTAMTFATTPITVASAAGFAVNDLIVISDRGGATWNLFQITGISGNTLQHASSSIYNTTAALPVGWPLGGYPKGSLVYKASRLTYRVDSLNFGRPCLVRQEFNGQPQAVAYDLNRFQVWYRMQDSTLTRDPMAWGAANGFANGRDYIAEVQPRIIVRVTGRNRPTLLDSVWAEVRPRTF